MTKSLTTIIALCTLLISSSAHACSVPVFRYPLERWQATDYRLLLVQKGDLTVDQKTVLEQLKPYFDIDNKNVLNAVMFNVTSKDIPENEAELKALANSFTETRLVLFPPFEHQSNMPIDHFPLTSDAVKQLVESPLRQQIVKEIMDGATSAWLFYSCLSSPYL